MILPTATSWLPIIAFCLACGLPHVARVSLAQRSAASATASEGDIESPRASADTRQSSAEWYYGYELFQLLLEDQAVNVLPDIEAAYAAPQQSIVVLAGSAAEQLANSEWARLIEFVQSGGSLLITSERSRIDEQLGRFGGGIVTSSKPALQYQGFEDCVRVSLADELASEVTMDLFSGISTVVTNRSGWFVPNDSGVIAWESLIDIPEGCQPASSVGQSLLAFGEAGQPDARGRILVLADASLLTNGMLWHGDNAIFAIRASQLLLDAERSQLYFLADNRVLGSSHARLADRAERGNRSQREPDLQKALRLGNAILKELASSNVLNEALRQQPRNLPASDYFRALLWGLLAILLLLAMWILWTYGILRGKFPQRRKMLAAYEINTMAGQAGGDYRNALGYVAREFCWSQSGSHRSSDWQRYFRTILADPKLLDANDRQRLRTIVDIACRGSQNAITRQDFERLGKTMHRLSAKLASRRVHA